MIQSHVCISPKPVLSPCHVESHLCAGCQNPLEGVLKSVFNLNSEILEGNPSHFYLIPQKVLMGSLVQRLFQKVNWPLVIEMISHASPAFHTFVHTFFSA